MSDQGELAVITVEKLKQALGLGHASTEFTILASIEALKEQARARPAVGVNWERRAEKAEGWRKQHEAELVALREAMGDGPADTIERLTREAQIAQDSGDRRSEGARNASESRRIRILELETRVRTLSSDQMRERNEHAAERRRWLDERHDLEQRITGQRHQLADHERKYAAHGAFRKQWEMVYDVLGITKGVFSRSPQTVFAMVKGLKEASADAGALRRRLTEMENVSRETSTDRGMTFPAALDRVVHGSYPGLPVYDGERFVGYASVNPKNGHLHLGETAARAVDEVYGEQPLTGYSIYGPEQARRNQEPRTAPSEPEGVIPPWSLNAEYHRAKEAALADVSPTASPARCEHGYHLGPIWHCHLDAGHFGDHQPTTAVVGREAIRQVGNYQQALRNTRDEAISGLNAD